MLLRMHRKVNLTFNKARGPKVLGASDVGAANYPAGVTRIIAGSRGGRTIAVPPRGTRPTSDRVREALFAALDSADLLDGATVLDLYAGSGALGLEAASRGAESVLLVEHDRRAAQVCRDNATTLGLPQVSTTEAKVEAFLARTATARFDLVFADPPYDLAPSELDHMLNLLVPHLASDAVVVVERSSRSPQPTLPAGLELWRTRTYGETAIYLLDHPPAREPEHDGVAHLI